jgi:hypothetical protein
VMTDRVRKGHYDDDLDAIMLDIPRSSIGLA